MREYVRKWMSGLLVLALCLSLLPASALAAVQTEAGQSFGTKFEHTDKYLYRVGNGNAVKLDSLFKLGDDFVSANFSKDPTAEKIKITALAGNVGSEISNTSIKFTGTGIVQVTVAADDTYGAEPFTLNLEVVDAKNYPSADAGASLSATANNVVLLADITTGSNTIEVSNGYSFYGNGFTIMNRYNGQALNSGGMGSGFISVSSDGTLDHVKLDCAIYPRAFIYATSGTEYVTQADNKTDTIGTKNYYGYQYSGVTVSGGGTVSNCYIKGARNNILINGSATITNTTCDRGSLANIHMKGSSSDIVTLNNVTTVQYLSDDDFNQGKKVEGVGVLVGDESGNNPSLTISGALTQHNWVCSKDGDDITSSTVAKMIVGTALKQTKFIHKYNDTNYVNMGLIVFNNAEINLTDNSTNQGKYDWATISLGFSSGKVYSLTTDNGSVSLEHPEYVYRADENGTGTDEVKLCYVGNEEYTVNEVYDVSSHSLIPTIRTEIGENESRQIAVKDIVAVRMGESYNATSYTVNGESVDAEYILNCDEAGPYSIGLSGTTAGYYDKNGDFVEDEKNFNLLFNFLVISTAIEKPQLIFDSEYNTYANMYKTGNGDWKGVWKALSDVDVRYFSRSRGCYVQVPLDVFTPAANGKPSGTYNYWTGRFDDCTLTLTSTSVIHSKYNDCGYFTVYDGELYLTHSNDVSNATTSRSSTIKYEFTDCNSYSISVSKSRTVEKSSAIVKAVTGTSSKYYLRLDPGAGTVSPNAFGPYNSNVTVTLPTPTRTGYRFLGWFDAPTGGANKDNSYKTTAGNVVLYAHWEELVRSTVKFDADGGVCEEPMFTGYANDVHSLPEVSRSGYWLDGWYDDDGRVGGAEDDYILPKHDVTLYAHWSPKYTVTYNANGGTVGPESAVYEGTALMLPAPTNGSKTFEGWYTAAEGGNLIGKKNEQYTPAADIDLFAQWSDNILVEFDGNGGTADTNSDTYDHVKPITLPDATWVGHQFNGWYTEASGGTKVGDAGASYAPMVPATLYAQWTAYTVSFDGNGGTNPNSQSAGNDGTVTLPTPTRTGYTFNGWYTETIGGKKIGNGGASYTPTAHIALHAQWTINSYKVTIATSNSTTAVTVNGTTVSSGGSVEYNSVVKVELSYSESNSLTFTIKQGSTNVTRYSNETCTTSTTSTDAGTYYFKMPAGAVTINSSSSKSSSSSCVAAGTLITLADGTMVPVENLTGDELLLVWNLETGSYDAAPMVFIDSDPEAEYTVIHPYFDDGTDVEIISSHGFFDLNLGEYVYFYEDAAQYIGHSFVKDNGDGTWSTVKLTDVVIEAKTTTPYSPVTFKHLCYYVNGMLSMPGGISGLFNIYDVDTNTMAYDPTKKDADIAEYGLLTLDDYGGMIPEIVFEAFNGADLGVAIGKGILTWEDIEYLANRYVPLVDLAEAPDPNPAPAPAEDAKHEEPVDPAAPVEGGGAEGEHEKEE
ncbi:MAG: InlB B-repeat-containing protein [Oscillospiraceae bacterium]|nr:InlB B-repeat-containing protein [Oscillospiraceae bacterium]